MGTILWTWIIAFLGSGLEKRAAPHIMGQPSCGPNALLEDGSTTHGGHIVHVAYGNSAVGNRVKNLSVPNIDANMAGRSSQACIEHEVSVLELAGVVNHA